MGSGARNNWGSYSVGHCKYIIKVTAMKNKLVHIYILTACGPGLVKILRPWLLFETPSCSILKIF